MAQPTKQGLELARQLVEELGGVENVRRALELLEALQFQTGPDRHNKPEQAR